MRWLACAVALLACAQATEMLDDICNICFDMDFKQENVHRLEESHKVVKAGNIHYYQFSQVAKQTSNPKKSSQQDNALQPARKLMAADRPHLHLNVGVSLLAPFVKWNEPDDHSLGMKGFAIDIWDTISQDEIKDVSSKHQVTEVNSEEPANGETPATAADTEQPEENEKADAAEAKHPKGEGNVIDATGNLVKDPYAPGYKGPAPAAEAAAEEAAEKQSEVQPSAATALLQTGSRHLLESVDPEGDAAEQPRKEYLVTYSLVSDTFSANLEKLAKGELDVVATGVAINSNELNKFKFSNAFWFSGIAIAVPERPVPGSPINGKTDVWSNVKGALTVLLTMLVFIVISGHLFWLCERPKKGGSDEKNVPSRKYLDGAGLGIWWAAVTLTTVGYGDVTPHTRKGKCWTVVWMFISLFVLSAFTANIVSALTAMKLAEPSVDSIADLDGMRVGFLTGSVATVYCARHHPGIKQVLFGDFDSAIVAMLKGDVVAIIGSSDALAYEAREGDHADDVATRGQPVHKHPIAFAFKKSTPDDVLDYFNYRLLRAQFSNSIDNLVKLYMQPKPDPEA